MCCVTGAGILYWWLALSVSCLFSVELNYETQASSVRYIFDIYENFQKRLIGHFLSFSDLFIWTEYAHNHLN